MRKKKNGRRTNNLNMNTLYGQTETLCSSYRTFLSDDNTTWRFTFALHFENNRLYRRTRIIRVQTNMWHNFLPFWCVFYVRQAIKTAARDLVLHGIASQSNRPSIINGVRFYDCCSNINYRLSRSKKASNINLTWILTDFP